MISFKYTIQCVQVRPLSTRLINWVKLAGPFVNLKGITLIIFIYITAFLDSGLPRGNVHKHPYTIPQAVKVGHTTGVYDPYSFSIVLFVLLCPTKTNQGKCREMGPTVFLPYPRKLKSITICRCHYIGSTFWVQPGFEPVTVCLADRCSPNWAIIRWR